MEKILDLPKDCLRDDMYEIAKLFFVVDSLSLYCNTLFCILDTDITFRFTIMMMLFPRQLEKSMIK